MRKNLYLFTLAVLLSAFCFQSCDRKDEPVAEEQEEVVEPAVPAVQDAPKDPVPEDDQKDQESQEDFIFPGYFNKTRLSLDEDQKKNIDPSNDFAFNFLRKHYGEGGNVFLSTLGIQTVLAMEGNRSSSDGAEFCKVLGLEGDDVEAVNGYFKRLIGDLTGEECGNELKFSSAYMSDVFAMKMTQEYLDLLKEYYYADHIEIEAKTLDEQPVGDRPEDLWFKEKTGGLISTAPLPILPFDESLMNAVYFKDAWLFPFEKDATKQDKFFTSPEKEIIMPMMNILERFNYYVGDDFRAVSLPFKHNSFDLTILLPSKRFDLEGLMGKLSSSVWSEMRKKVVVGFAQVSIPSFETSYSIELPLSDFFPRVTGKLAQKTIFKIDEEGASAVAATQSMLATSPGEPKIETFIADSPFIYTITESGSGLILFIGVYSGADKEEMIQS